jgi:signal transduction histidine kinase/CheY-like chemotaxis protein
MAIQGESEKASSAYVRVCGLVAAAAALHWAIEPISGARIPFLFFIPALLIAASWLGRGPALLVVLAGAINGVLLIRHAAPLTDSNGADFFVLFAYVALGVPLAIYGSRLRLVSLRAMETEQRLSLVQRDAGIGLFELDYAAGTALVSPSLCRLLEQEVVVGPISIERWLAMLPQDHVQDSNISLQQRVRDGDLNYEREHRLNMPDGKKRWLLSRIRLEVGADGKLATAYGATMDITPRKELDLALRESQAQLKRRVEELDCLHQCSMRLLKTTELADQLAVILDSVLEFHNADKGLLTLRNPADGVVTVAAHRGFSRAGVEMLAAISSRSESTKEALANHERILNEDVETNTRFQEYRELARLEGFRSAHTTSLVSSSGGALGMLTVCFAEPRKVTEREALLADICAQKATVFIERANARENAARIDQRFRVALESSAVPFIILLPIRDSAGEIVDFRYDYANPKAAEFLRHPLKKLLGARVSEVVLGAWDRPGLLDRYTGILESGRADEFELPCHRDGIEDWRLVVASPLEQSLAVWFADITDRKHHAQSLEEADRRKDEFLATLAHELRNPLAPIRHATVISRSEKASPEQKRWSHEVIDRQVQHMSLMLDDLLDVSRITRGALQLRKSQIELASVISAGVEIARPLIEARQHSLTFDPLAESLMILADPLRLTQVMGNLLTNAAKYTPNGGHIHISAGGDAGEAWISVADNGEGLSADVLQDIFRMFAQVKATEDRAGGGLGIGLALARGLVSLHGGMIEVHSDGLGKGSRFIVRLPRGDIENTQPKDLAPNAVSGSARQVLVADDNKDAAEALAELLRLDGHHVVLAFDGEAAVAEFQRSAPEVALIDIGMPKLSGLQVARQIRQLTKHPVKLIAISGWGQESDKRRNCEAGFDHHITKPIDINMLRHLLAA